MINRSIGEPRPDEVRAALNRIIASDLLRHSPQLVAFIRFIVETTLRGEASRIKGYTIAIEAFGRGESFDPETDPIVRVEAGRLRRALEQYYTRDGATDDIVIELPRGRYVPSFRRIEHFVPVFSWVGGVKDKFLAAIPVAWRFSLAALALLVVGTTTLIAVGRWDRQTSTTALGLTDQQLIRTFRPGSGFPVVSVHAFEA